MSARSGTDVATLHNNGAIEVGSWTDHDDRVRTDHSGNGEVKPLAGNEEPSLSCWAYSVEISY